MSHNTSSSSDSESSKEDRAKQQTDAARRIATTLARGNVSLQLGNFETAEQLQAQRETFKDYEF